MILYTPAAMNRELIRIGTGDENSKMDVRHPFNILFGGFHQFIHLADGYDVWARVNGSWRGALKHLLNGTIP
jgi:hypothetical protein